MSTADLERAFATTRSVLANVTSDQLSNPTPCQSWNVRDLINHFVGVSRWCAEAANSGVASAPPTTDFTIGDMPATYDEGIAQAVDAFGRPGALDKAITLPFGSLPGAVYLGIITTDAFTHGWDLARATGQSTDLDPEFAAKLLEGSRAFIQPAFRGEDTIRPFGAEQPAPPDATNADALAAFLGRKV
ncbi:MAG TPA: TIGR03086 family metal-binding protein [Acidimicrobiia bacterium]|nr:TIGR03086 family metal-binding protein [Acidimicrobiia bacterium]